MVLSLPFRYTLSALTRGISSPLSLSASNFKCYSAMTTSFRVDGLPGKLDIAIVPCLRDNYAYLLRDVSSGATAVVDPSESKPVEAALADLGWENISLILNTHHHNDHIGGNEALHRRFCCQVIAPARERGRIPGIDIPVEEDDVVTLGKTEFSVIETPGHTRGHICFYSAHASSVFTGDTLFSLGCGRLFEGSAQEMFQSLEKLKCLPPETRVFCGHEYTQANSRFAIYVEEDNSSLQKRAKEIAILRAEGQPTIPTTIALEQATNPFLRCGSQSIRRKLGLTFGPQPPHSSNVTGGEVEVFRKLRQMKDTF
eukprot:TRINITY_DN14070_c0_g1_i1.p1 TRINITY_DN14070_c0_g1~~TRINITY_DN14070_c0_g1_i1.p1  ORF type:complete len:313 (-),score=53.55 TRINITY_DN14070_c0_g1_i1:119-1057(-)